MRWSVYKNRLDAGNFLAEDLSRVNFNRPLVLALPRGGVPVAYPIAQRLEAPLDVLLVRKIGAPFQEELAIGAVSEDGTVWRNDSLLARADVPESYIQDVVLREMKKMRDQARIFRGEREIVPVQNREVILVDDGIATGATIFAAVNLLKRKEPSRIMVASPMCSPEVAERLRSLNVQVLCTIETDDFDSVGSFYRDFTQVEDEEVQRLLLLANPIPPEGAGNSHYTKSV